MLKARAERWDKCALLFIISAFSLFVGVFVLQCKSRYNLFILTVQYVCSQGIEPMTWTLRVAVELDAHDVDILSDEVNDLQPFVPLFF